LRVSEFYVYPPDLNGISRAAHEIRFEDALRRDVVGILRKQKRRVRRRFGNEAVISTGFKNGAAAVVYRDSR